MSDEQERLRRWRLVLGGQQADGTGQALSGLDAKLDQVLASLYGEGEEGQRSAGLGGSAPRVARWLGDIREYFPKSVVRVMQQDAMKRHDLRQLMLEPELLEAVEPNIHLVADLISLGRLMPDKSRDTARQVVRRLVDELVEKLDSPVRQAVSGALNRAVRNRRPRHNEIDWQRTIRANLRHYQPEHRTIIPEQLIGYGRKRRAHLKDIVLCVDQSGSMATSVVYASIFAAVLASIPAVKTSLVVFDTEIVDLTELLADPVEVLFGTQLGGGTDINRAVGYCQGKIERAPDTTLILITDLYEGGNGEELLKRVAGLSAAGVQIITLLALNDDGAPSYEHGMAQAFAALGIPTFACTPDLFPDLMAAALKQEDVGLWAAKHEIVTARG